MMPQSQDRMGPGKAPEGQDKDDAHAGVAKHQGRDAGESETSGARCPADSPSPEPSSDENGWAIVERTTRSWRSAPLESAQVVLVRSPLEPEKMVVKRITGLPGDAITVRPPAWDKHNSLGIERRLEVVPEGHVWLEGDNQDNSKDSRKFGSVPQGLVEGVVCFRVWPPSGFGLFE
eukprot:jgi/Undpi1/12584/HiC_scaffold_6.g02253.m1